MIVPSLMEKVAKTQREDRLHDAEIAQFWNDARRSRVGLKYTRLALILSGIFLAVFTIV